MQISRIRAQARWMLQAHSGASAFWRQRAGCRNRRRPTVTIGALARLVLQSGRDFAHSGAGAP
eukprot:2688707-Pyramimonas_sp.AAC.1